MRGFIICLLLIYLRIQIMFKTDGSVHYSGIANEGKTAEILNAINYFPNKVLET